MGVTPMVSLEIIGHSTMIVSFLGVFYHTFRSQQRMQRTFRQARVLFWIILTVCGFSILTNSARLYFLITQQSDNLFPFVDLFAEYPSIIALSLIIAYLLRNKIVIEKTIRPRRILAIGAHPDDIEIAAGATLAKLHDGGNYIFGLVLTQGEFGGDARVRPLEARNGARFLGLDDIKIMSYSDGCLEEEWYELIKTIESTIGEVRPDIILTHSAHDIHQDHQAVHEATLRAGRSQCTILCYESPSASPDFVPTFFVNVADYVSIKINAMAAHWDQKEKPYMKEEQVRGKLAFRGGQAKVEYAEGYEIVRLLSANIGELG